MFLHLSILAGYLSMTWGGEEEGLAKMSVSRYLKEILKKKDK
jgi:hypothetical protein